MSLNPLALSFRNHLFMHHPLLSGGQALRIRYRDMGLASQSNLVGEWIRCGLDI